MGKCMPLVIKVEDLKFNSYQITVFSALFDKYKQNIHDKFQQPSTLPANMAK